MQMPNLPLMMITLNPLFLLIVSGQNQLYIEISQQAWSKVPE